MYQVKTFKTKQAMEKWINANHHVTQWEEVFINNGFAVGYKKLRFIDFND